MDVDPEFWRGKRVLLFDLLADPKNWFMLAVALPKDFSYGSPDDDVKPDAIIGE